MKKLVFMFSILLFSFGLFGCSNNDVDFNKKNMVKEAEISKAIANPDEYKGKSIRITGQIFTMPKQTGDTIEFQMFNDTKNKAGNVFVKTSNHVSVKQDDYVIVKGVIDGLYSGDNSLGEKVNALEITSSSIEISNYKEVVVPALATFFLTKVEEKDDIKIKITTIEFAKTETRLYLEIKNNRKDKITFNSFDTKLIVEGKQYGELDSYVQEHDAIETSIKPGAKETGVVILKPVKNFKEKHLDFNFNFKLEKAPYKTSMKISIDTKK